MSLPSEYGGQGIPELIAVIGKETQLAANQGFTIGASLSLTSIDPNSLVSQVLQILVCA